LLFAVGGLAVPGPLIGLGIIWLLDRDQPAAVAWLYDRTVTAPVLALAVRTLPLTILICGVAWRTLAADVLEAAACDGAGPWIRFWRIAIPQRLPALTAAWLAGLAWAAGDLACSILVVPPGITTVPIRVFGLVHSGVDQQVAGICLVAAAGYAVLAACVLALLARKR
jgi:iron(III) transport system permease protein